MQFPDNLKYTKKTTNGCVKETPVISASQTLLSVSWVILSMWTLPATVRTLAMEDTFRNCRSCQTVSDLYMPVSGTISEVNPELDGAPELINQDPYGKGWMIKVEMSDPLSWMASWMQLLTVNWLPDNRSCRRAGLSGSPCYGHCSSCSFRSFRVKTCLLCLSGKQINWHMPWCTQCSVPALFLH